VEPVPLQKVSKKNVWSLLEPEFLRAGCPSCYQPTVSKHWRKRLVTIIISGYYYRRCY